MPETDAARRSTYTAAGVLPAKLLLAQRPGDPVRPLHVQLFPTNRCNLRCPWCSCAGRDSGEELSLAAVVRLADDLAALGTRAVTVTGGGEPLEHPRFAEVAAALAAKGLRLGLVTNGYLLGRASRETLDLFDWCRVSVGADRCALFGGKGLERLATVLDGALGGRTAWAFSCVVRGWSPAVPWALSYAQQHGFTHVRFVPDLLDGYGDPDAVGTLAARVRADGIDDRLAIWQDRSVFSRGRSPCRVSLLRPVVAADGNLYPCCGVQYADARPAVAMPAAYRMGAAGDLPRLVEGQRFFAGSRCVRCYYDLHNGVLDALAETPGHAAFV